MATVPFIKIGTLSVPDFIWYRGQVVRQESAKLSFASSNLAGTSKKKRTPFGVRFLFGATGPGRFEPSNATVRWTVAGDGLTEPNLNYFFPKERNNVTNPAGTSSDH